MTKRRNTRWTDKALREIAAGCKTRTEFYTKHRQAYAAAQRREMLDEVCAHMSIQNGMWDEASATAEAKKYTTRGAFASGSAGAYNYAYRRGLLDTICAHMPAHVSKSTRKWTRQTVTAEAAKYEDRKAFRKGSRSAYVTAHREGWIDELFS